MLCYNGAKPVSQTRTYIAYYRTYSASLQEPSGTKMLKQDLLTKCQRLSPQHGNSSKILANTENCMSSCHLKFNGKLQNNNNNNKTTLLNLLAGLNNYFLYCSLMTCNLNALMLLKSFVSNKLWKQTELYVKDWWWLNLFLCITLDNCVGKHAVEIIA